MTKAYIYKHDLISSNDRRYIKRKGDNMKIEKDNIGIQSTYGFILRGTLDDVEYIMQCIEEDTKLNVVYQKSSQSELYIVDKKEK